MPNAGASPGSPCPPPPHPPPRSALDTLQPRAASYEGAGTALREALAVALEGRELWAAAARALAAVDLDSGARPQDGDARLARQVRIAQLYLEDDDAGAAEAYVKKAAGLAAATRDAGLELQYRACAARVLDAKRRFLEAGARYYELSHAAAGLAASRASSGPGASEAGASAAGASGAGVSGAGASGAGPSGVGPSSAGPSGGAHPALGTGGIPRPATGMVDEGEVLQALAAAVTCACLAPAGPQRSRLLATLVKDERTLGLPLRGFLEKVHTERLLERSEVGPGCSTTHSDFLCARQQRCVRWRDAAAAPAAGERRRTPVGAWGNPHAPHARPCTQPSNLFPAASSHALSCTSAQVEAFEATLAPHQRAVLPDGHTVLGRAIMEHNLQSVSKLYSSVRVRGRRSVLR